MVVNLWQVQEVHDKGTLPTISVMHKRYRHLEELDALEPQDMMEDVKTEAAEVKMEEKEVDLKPSTTEGISTLKISSELIEEEPSSSHSRLPNANDKSNSVSTSHQSSSARLEISIEMELEGWTNIRLDRWLVDWCLRNGMFETAETLAKERGIEVCGSLSQWARLTLANLPRIWWTSLSSSRFVVLKRLYVVIAALKL